MNESNYCELAFAIVEQAVDDYRSALKALKRHPDDTALARVVYDYERWFMGEWFEELAQSSVDGLTLICTMRDQIGV